MAGFSEPQRVFRLEIEDGDFAGAEVVCRRNVSMDAYLTIYEGQSGSVEAVERAMRVFGDAVVSEWNVERDGAPIPPDGDGIMSLSPEFATLLLATWLKGVTEVPVPLGPSSKNGSTSATRRSSKSRGS